MNRLVGSYTEATGLDPKEQHPEWNIAHRTIAEADIPTIEQVGGDAIWDKTVAECRNAPGETMLYRVANSMISNTK